MSKKVIRSDNRTTQIDFPDEYEEEEEEEEENGHDIITIELISHSIQLKYSQLCKYSELIAYEYPNCEIKLCFSPLIQQFEKDNNIKDENVLYFFNFFKNGKISITNDSYHYIFKLSEFLKVNKLMKQLKKYKRKNINNLDFIISTIIDENNLQNEAENIQSELSYEMEQDLISRIDECLQK